MRPSALTLAFLLLALPVAAQAPLPPVQPPGQTAPGPQPGTGAVKQQIQAIRRRYQAQREQLKGQIQQQRQELATLLQNNAPSNETEAKLQDIIHSEGQREALLLQEYYEISAVLPPRAKAQYTERVVNTVLRRRQPPPANQPSPQQQANPQ